MLYLLELKQSGWYTLNVIDRRFYLITFSNLPPLSTLSMDTLLWTISQLSFDKIYLDIKSVCERRICVFVRL